MYKRPANFKEGVDGLLLCISQMRESSYDAPYSNFLNSVDVFINLGLLDFFEIACAKSEVSKVVFNTLCPLLQKTISEPNSFNESIMNSLKNPDSYASNTKKAAEFLHVLNKKTKKCIKREGITSNLKKVAELLYAIFSNDRCQEAFKLFYVSNMMFRTVMDLSLGQLEETFDICTDFGGSHIPFQFMML